MVARRVEGGRRRAVGTALARAGLIACALAALWDSGAAHAAPSTATAAEPLTTTVTLKPPPAADARDDGDALPIPPIPPEAPPGAQAAPLPNLNAASPVTTLQTSRPGLRPDVYRPKSYNRGDGYTNGSGQYDEGRFKQGPSGGLRLDVPLQ